MTPRCPARCSCLRPGPGWSNRPAGRRHRDHPPWVRRAEHRPGGDGMFATYIAVGVIGGSGTHTDRALILGACHRRPCQHRSGHAGRPAGDASLDRPLTDRADDRNARRALHPGELCPDGVGGEHHAYGALALRPWGPAHWNSHRQQRRHRSRHRGVAALRGDSASSTSGPGSGPRSEPSRTTATRPGSAASASHGSAGCAGRWAARPARSRGFFCPRTSG